MAQTASASYQELDASPAKRPDFLFVIAGWHEVYAVADDTYTLSAGAHDVSSTNGFTRIRKWAGLPEISAAKMKGAFPEAGGFDIGDLKIELLDKHGVSTTTRDLTDLLSRQAYIEGNKSGVETTTSAVHTKTATTINLASTTGIVAGDVIHISQEAILVGTVASGTQLTGCTRGYLLTNATRHETSVKVYGYIPNLEGRPCWLFKGYRDLALSSWLKAWGGLITTAARGEPGKVSLQARSTTWAMWGGSAPQGGSFGSFRSKRGGRARSPSAGVRRLVRVRFDFATQDNGDYPDVNILGSVLDGDYRAQFILAADPPSGLGDGHYMLRAGDALLGICNPLRQEIVYDGGSFIDADLVKGPGDTSPNVVLDDADQLQVCWSNVSFTTTARVDGTDPIDLMLKLLCSTGTGTNNATYDVFVKGIGLGIPVEQIDLDTFTDVQDQLDYGTLRVYFVFTESVDAKEFIDEELCKPFGWYLATGNDGRIRLVRPKNPAKVHFSNANNQFRFTHSADPNTVRQFTLPGGVYTPSELVAALQVGFRAVSGDTSITVTDADAGDDFVVEIATGGATFDFTLTDAWRTLGYTSSQASDVCQAETAIAGTADSSTFGVATVTKNDVIAGSISIIPNGSARVGRVNFGCNYSWADDRFDYHVFEDAEIENLSAFGDSAPYEVNSKGLLRAFSGTRRVTTPWDVFLPPSTGCMGVQVAADSSHGIDASDSFAALLCEHLFDRYRFAPLRFKCRLKWRFNTREIGDVLMFTHDVDGALIDQELGVAVVTARLFEIVSIRPIPASGCVEVELLGHRAGG